MRNNYYNSAEYEKGWIPRKKLKNLKDKRKKLEALVKEDRVVCTKHNEGIDLQMMYSRKCYIAYRRKKGEFCQYIKIRD